MANELIEEERDPLKYVTAKQISEYRDAFDLFDMDGDGTITVEEIYKVLQSLGRHTTKEEIEKILSCADIDEYRDAFDLFDMDGDGTITVEEIYKVLQSLGRHTTKEEIEKILSCADIDGQ
ncbi:hypothetical protein CAPTEDRAFT_194292 [Capitella teleta]|uniref:EF-hand domain-containing protein n=1 Tax=Capitella teleta TaxID=283909 RepID=R7UD21_CAPTE|nr:hypothetical protein CAPTEDRAFT_194292 [Capitella teleta]|eukprot:ELU04285.1 hypothetical protein CAPTEDRAFT_194292 [Capitella teleta]